MAFFLSLLIREKQKTVQIVFLNRLFGHVQINSLWLAASFAALTEHLMLTFTERGLH